MDNWINVILPILGVAAGLIIKIPVIQVKLNKARIFGKEMADLFKSADSAIKSDSIGGENVAIEEMKGISKEAKEAWAALKDLVSKEVK